MVGLYTLNSLATAGGRRSLWPSRCARLALSGTVANARLSLSYILASFCTGSHQHVCCRQTFNELVGMCRPLTAGYETFTIRPTQKNPRNYIRDRVWRKNLPTRFKAGDPVKIWGENFIFIYILFENNIKLRRLISCFSSAALLGCSLQQPPPPPAFRPEGRWTPRANTSGDTQCRLMRVRLIMTLFWLLMRSKTAKSNIIIATVFVRDTNDTAVIPKN